MNSQNENFRNISEWLESMGLDKYSMAFKNVGYENMSDIPRSDANEIRIMLDKVGIKGGSAVKIKNSLKKMNEQNGFPVGKIVQAKWTDGHFYNATIEKKTMNGYIVNYYEFQMTQEIPRENIKNVPKEKNPSEKKSNDSQISEMKKEIQKLKDRDDYCLITLLMGKGKTAEYVANKRGQPLELVQYIFEIEKDNIPISLTRTRTRTGTSTKRNKKSKTKKRITTAKKYEQIEGKRSDPPVPIEGDPYDAAPPGNPYDDGSSGNAYEQHPGIKAERKRKTISKIREEGNPHDDGSSGNPYEKHPGIKAERQKKTISKKRKDGVTPPGNPYDKHPASGNPYDSDPTSGTPYDAGPPSGKHDADTPSKSPYDDNNAYDAGNLKGSNVSKSDISVAQGPYGAGQQAGFISNRKNKRKLIGESITNRTNLVLLAREFIHGDEIIQHLIKNVDKDMMNKINSITNLLIHWYTDEIDLRNMEFTDMDCEEIGDLLMRFTPNDRISSVSSLDLSKNTIGASGAKRIIQGLASHSSLTQLFISCNKIGPLGAHAIAHAMKKNSTLKTLKMNTNEIGEKGAREISNLLEVNSTLTELWLENNEIGNYGADRIAEALVTNITLKVLHLGNNNISHGASSLFEALYKQQVNYQNITEMSISTNSLKNFERIQNQNSDQKSGTVTFLTVKGFRTLASEAILMANGLRTLNLQGNNIRDEEAKELSKCIKSVKKFVDVLSEVSSQPSNNDDDYTSQFENPITGECSLEDTLLDIKNRNAIDCTLPDVIYIKPNVGSSGNIYYKLKIIYSRAISSLTDINLHGNLISLNGAKIIGDGLKVDAFIKKITLFSLIDLPIFLQENLEKESINFMGKNYNDVDIVLITSLLTINSKMKALDLRNNPIGHHAAQIIVNMLLTLPTFSTLNTIRLKDFFEKSEISLCSKDLDDSSAFIIASMLEKSTTLQSLSLKDNKITDKGAHEIATSLKTNQSILKKFDISQNRIQNGIRVADLFVDSFKNSGFIEEINLNTKINWKEIRTNSFLNEKISMDFGNLNYDVIDVQLLLSIWKENDKFRTVELRNTSNVTMDAKNMLCGFILDAHEVNHKTITFNKIDVNRLVPSSRDPNTMKLNAHQLDDLSAMFIAKPLQNPNNRLKVLNLCQNNIKFNGAEALADMLRSNKNLEKLWLKGNQIESEGCIELLEALKFNNSLRKLWLHYNNIVVQKVIPTIKALLDINKTIIVIKLIDGNEINSATKKILLEFEDIGNSPIFLCAPDQKAL